MLKQGRLQVSSCYVAVHDMLVDDHDILVGGGGEWTAINIKVNSLFEVSCSEGIECNLSGIQGEVCAF